MRHILILCLFALSAHLAVGAGGKDKTALLDGVAAHVNGHTITIGDVMSVLLPVRQELQAKYSGAELDEELKKSYAEVTDRLIDERVILDFYEEQKDAKFPESVVDQRVEEIVARRFNGDRSALISALTEDKISYAEWREEMRRHMIVAAMRRAHVTQNTKVSPVEVRREYNRRAGEFVKPARVKLRMAIVAASEGTGGQTGLQLAENIVALARGGQDFGELVKAHSTGSRAATGGDWGWLDETDLRQEFRDALAGMSVGDVSDPVRIGDELYVLKVDEKEDSNILTFEDVQADIERQLREKEAEHIYAAWVARLRERAYIKVFDPGKLWD